MSSGADILGTDENTATPSRAGRRSRILYAAGMGDILGTYRHWKARQDDPSQLSMTYSGQFFDVCRRKACDGIVLVHDARRGVVRDGEFVIRQTRLPRFRNGPGILYHLEQIMAAVRIVMAAIRYRAEIVIVASGASHWFPLAVLPLLGKRVVPSLHCVLWPKYQRPGLIGRLINHLDGWFFGHSAAAILTTSHDIDDQLCELLGDEAVHNRLRVVPFLPSYRPEHFPQQIAPPPAPPFRVLYAGRVEPEKGAFDILTIAAALHAEGHGRIEFDICGIGSALEEMKRRAELAGLKDWMRFHGHCDKPAMMKMFQNCHVVLVPTTTDFVEGFNQVVAEGILSGRPVVTSEVCPAVRYVGDAAVVVPPDDVKAYARGIARLADDAAFYRRCVGQCEQVRAQFFDERRSWGAAVESAMNLAGIA